eukprot:jgi/Astpho2/5100/fgenesh1_pm.00073_%23_4_t
MEPAGRGWFLDLLPDSREFVAPPLDELSDERAAEVLREVFGHQGFRGLQLEVVRRVLQGTSTLAILPTGWGKSLCYQMPALLLGGTTLVVSPLLALMQDQLQRLPPQLPAGMLWGGQSKQEALQVLGDLRAGRLRLLYVAPERLHSWPLLQALQPIMPLSAVCIDEAHCVAEWGHNFRSAYFRLGHLLKQKVQARCVLALTATATRATEAEVATALDIQPENRLRDSNMRDNLRLSVVHHNGGTANGGAKRALLALLREGALREAASVIVYCTFQSQADEVARFLYTSGVSAVSYHARKHMKERDRILTAFCAGRMRVVVATVAFGMGVDAQGVRGVVHMSLPRSLEEYVQQVGRAGRDGCEAACTAFLDDGDFLRLRSLAHADGTDQPNVHSFLEAVFAKPASADGGEQALPWYGTLAISKCAAELDMKEETMETLLSYLEAHDGQLVHMLPSTGVTIQVSFYDKPAEEYADGQPIIAALLRICPKHRRGCYTVATADLMNALGAPMSQVRAVPQALMQLSEELAGRHAAVGRQQLERLDTCYCALAAAARQLDTRGCVLSTAAQQEGAAAQEQSLRGAVSSYFDQSLPEPAMPPVSCLGLAWMGSGVWHGLQQICLMRIAIRANETRLVVLDLQGVNLTARAVTRILHGIASPAYPSDQWHKCGFWQRFTNLDFAEIMQLALTILEAPSS